MPQIDAPDFQKIAERLTEEGAIHSDEDSRLDLRGQIAEQLRLVWNARGAADLAKIDHELTSMMGGQAAGPYVKNLDRALRGLDR